MDKKRKGRNRKKKRKEKKINGINGWSRLKGHENEQKCSHQFSDMNHFQLVSV